MKNITAIKTSKMVKYTKKIEEEIHSLYSINHAIIKSKDFNSALEVTLKKVCKLTGWIYGEVWLPSKDRQYLEYSKVWHSNIKGLEYFRNMSEKFKFLPGVGLPGRVWSSKKPEWRSNVTINMQFLRKQIAIDSGLKSAIGFPIFTDDEVSAVMVFLTSEILGKDKRMIELISTISYQLGTFLERKKVEEALHKSEKEIRNILDNIPDIFYRTNKDGQIMMISNAIKKVSGYEPKELIGRRVADLYADQDGRSKFLKKLEENGGRIDGYETLLKRKDGSEVWISASSQIYYDEEGSIQGVEGIVRDVTERKRLEKESLKTQKLEAVGILAGGIAHDFNNLLTAIIGYIGISKMHLQPDNKIFDWLTTTEKVCEKAKELSNRLITFSKGGVPIKDTISISDLIRETVSELLNGTNIICECNFPNDLHPVKIDERQIKQAIKNIVMNAKESMPGGGTLNIYINNIAITKEDNLPLKEGKYIKVSIEDNGKGIPEDIQSKVFDPYFTTKEMGAEKGRGLGLSICYSIIKQHNGLITFHSIVDVGTTFYIYLPVEEEK